MKNPFDMKLCRRCGVKKPTVLFNRHHQTKDRLQSWCKACASVANREYRLRKLAEAQSSKQPEPSVGFFGWLRALFSHA